MPRCLARQLSLSRIKYAGNGDDLIWGSSVSDFDLYEASCVDASALSSKQCLSTIANLDVSLQTYLLDQFWERFNTCTFLLHKEAFQASLHETRYGPFCSPHLHLAVLAMGLRRAHHTRPEVARLLRPNWDSVLHRQLREAVDGLLIRGGCTVVNVQAVVILAHLERERGRDHAARQYLDSAFSMMENIQQRTQNVLDMRVSDDEIIVQRTTLRAAVLIHSHWCFLDNRRLTKTSSTSVDNSPHRRGEVVASQHLHGSRVLSFTMKNDLAAQIYNAHPELVSIATSDIDEVSLCSAAANDTATENAFSCLVQIHTRLKNWYSGLPTHLSWSDDSQHSAPPNLYLLHQQ
ncbi:hypothetical protein EDD36DRAFT_489056 [Exophiala viscosa]|uniref:Transcription factor domain-containing protein n=1 Tax=Exophiala viscosa TaxID=2486360 RepID=A0AAN6DWF2_9EURO|nr:hypothetical protein EDD36DRAFT_489056 [Exophiala viscosa]